MILLDPNEVPKEIQFAAIQISEWMKKKGYDYWEFGDLCSRNHAHELNLLKLKLTALIKPKY